MGQLPTMPVGVDRYLADTAHLTLEEQGVHFRLQIYAWRSPGCCLPDDDARLARMLGISLKRWATLKPSVMALWTLKDGTWVNDQVAREHEFVTGKIEKKRAAGRLGGRPKSLPDNDFGKASGSENGKQNESEPKPATATATNTPIVPKGTDPPGFAEFTGHMIATALPQIEVSEAGRQERFGYVSAKTIEAIDGETPARSLLTNPLRELAAQVRAGEASPQVRRYEAPEPDFMPPPESMEAFVTERFSYLPKTGYAAEPVCIGKQRLPEPVALLAIEQGLAFEVEPVGWAGIRNRAQATANQQRSPADYPPIGFNLQEWRDAEAKRARDAWLVEQGREAA